MRDYADTRLRCEIGAKIAAAKITTELALEITDFADALQHTSDSPHLHNPTVAMSINDQCNTYGFDSYAAWG